MTIFLGNIIITVTEKYLKCGICVFKYDLRRYVTKKEYDISPEVWKYKRSFEDIFEGTHQNEEFTITERFKFLYNFIDQVITEYIKTLSNVDGKDIIDLIRERDIIFEHIQCKEKSPLVEDFIRDYDNEIITFNELLEWIIL